MRAVIITRPGGPEVLDIQNIALPEPTGDQVRVRVCAAGLNRADLVQRAGQYPAPLGSPATIPGLEFAGEVEAIGPLVQTWRLGQRVMGITGGGAQAEYVLSHEGLLIEIPAHLDFVQAAAIPEVFITAHDALFTQGGLQMGERVLIHAIGSGVGTAALQLAQSIGATVFGTSRSPQKREQAQTLGLDFALSEQNFAAQVKQHTQGAGVHLVLDFVGASYLEQNLDSLTTWGRLVLLATLGGAHANVNLAMVMAKRIQIRGCTLRSRTLAEKLAVTHRFTTQVVPLLARKRIQPIIAAVYPFDEIAAAHRVMAENHNFGKIVLRIEP